MSETSSPPLRTLRLERNGSDLLVMLPRAYMQPEDFVKRGFWATVTARRLALDRCAVDLNLETISSGKAVASIQQQIVAPARGAYRRVWLGGISLGGLLSPCRAALREHFLDSGLCGQPCDA